MSLESNKAVCVKSEPEWEGDGAGGVSEAATRAQADWLIDHEIKVEQDWESAEGACGVSEAAAREDLYRHHQVKDELVLGPEILQPPDAVFALQDWKIRSKFNKNTLFVKDCLKKDNAETVVKQKAMASCQVNAETIADVGDTPVVAHLTANNTNVVSNDKCNIHFTCDSCSQIFQTKLMLLEHKKTQHGQKRSLLGHDRKHAGEKPYKCGHCSYASSRSSDLLVHERIHTGEKPYKCAHCSYTCAQKSHLLVHQKIHTGEKPYKCAHCSYASAHKYHLLVHERTHTGERPFKCAHCSYASAHRSHLLVHERLHSGEKPYKCGHCSYAGTRKYHLLAHERIHTGERPFKCAHCSYASAKKSRLLVHERIHTGE